MGETPEILFTGADVGCVFDGHMGWHNNYRVVDLAVSHGMTLTDDERSALEEYRSRTDVDGDEVGGQGGLSDRATEYLQERTADGYVWEWDMGELTLLPICQTESFESGKECAHCGGTS